MLVDYLSQITIPGDSYFCKVENKKVNEIVKQVFISMRKIHTWYVFKTVQIYIKVLVDHLLKTKKNYKNLKKEEIQDTFIKMNQVKFAFSMTWLIGILRIYLEHLISIT